MCGIAGVVAAEPLTRDTLSRVMEMSAAMVHRGPDGQADFHDGSVALAMRRLSIIDLQGGQQPFFSEDGTLVLIANGEIYNHVELRDQLRADGHQFRSASDCEVIVHLYEQYGFDCVHHLRGMFAFALWDSRNRRLMLARDRMGEKPLYLYQNGTALYFASEMKALLAMGLVPFELEPAAVDLFFQYNYVPEPMTPIRGIRKLPAAHILLIDAATGAQREWCYWHMEDAPVVSGPPHELIRQELERICEFIVRSDVPVGVALSGGLDSSAIAAMAARKYPGVMQAFTVGYNIASPYDEREAAKRFAQYLGMSIHEVILQSEEVGSFFPELVSWLDDPIGDISAFGYYSVMKAAKARGVSVMLQGHGGDELFWGYPWLQQAAAQTIRKYNGRLTGSPKFRDYLALTGPEYWSLWGIKEWVKGGAGIVPSWEAYARDRSSPQEQTVFYDITPDFRLAQQGMKAIYTRSFADALCAGNAYRPFTAPTPWSHIDVLLTQLICKTYLLENGIAQGDRLSMASSVEVRLPFVDHRLVELVIGLRKASPDHGLPSKFWLRQALKDVLPDWVLNRPKRGFTPPLHEWHEAIFSNHGANLENGFLVNAGVLTSSAGRALARGPYPPRACSPISFKALTLELWCRTLRSRSMTGKTQEAASRRAQREPHPVTSASD